MRHIVHGSFHYEFDDETRAKEMEAWFEKTLNGVRDAKNKRVSVNRIVKPGGG